MFDNIEYQKVMNVPYTVIIASFIIIIITTNMTDKNGLSALLGGYSGLMLGMLFILVMNFTYTNFTYLDMFPILIILFIVGLLIFYLSKYFDKIVRGEVSNYYFNFSILSSIFLIAQTSIIFNALYGKSINQDSRLFTDSTFSLLSLIGIINFIAVLTMGIVLHFYTTQG